MKVMSFNTQHCRSFLKGYIDFDLMARAIKEVDPDIVGLNEMRGEGVGAEYTDQVTRLARLTGMGYYYFAKAIDVEGGGPYGNGILSKIPILKAETIPIPDPVGKRHGASYETRCILKAELLGGYTVLVSHFGLNPDERECAVRTVLENLCDERCILMGDFNEIPNAPVLAPIRERMTDTADYFEGERLSFPSDKPRRKIDYIFVSRDVKVASADIPPIVASDHRPHISTLL